MNDFTLIRSINDLPKPGDDIYLIITRYYSYNNGNMVIPEPGEEYLDYNFCFAKYIGEGNWLELLGEMDGYIENMPIEGEPVPSAGCGVLLSDIDGETVKHDVVAYHRLPHTPAEKAMRSILQK